MELDKEQRVGNATEGVEGQPVGQVIGGADGAGVDDTGGAVLTRLLVLAPGDADPELHPSASTSAKSSAPSSLRRAAVT